MHMYSPSSQGLGTIVTVALPDCLVGIGVPDKALGVVSPRVCRK